MLSQPNYTARTNPRVVAIAALVSCCLLTLPSSGSAAQDRHGKYKRYRSAGFAFNYPANLKLSVADHRNRLQIVVPSHSAYWQDTITVRKLNKKTEECDLPQEARPDSHDRRFIAGRTASAYSGEDAAMNRFTKVRGYFIETRNSCWRFELIRTGRPFQKFDLSAQEMKRLNRRSDEDFKKAGAAFKSVLDSFALARSER